MKVLSAPRRLPPRHGYGAGLELSWSGPSSADGGQLLLQFGGQHGHQRRVLLREVAAQAQHKLPHQRGRLCRSTDSTSDTHNTRTAYTYYIICDAFPTEERPNP